MLLNPVEFFIVNNRLREAIQSYEIGRLRKMVNIDRFDQILEIGCGGGNGTRLIRKHFCPTKIEAVDLDKRMIVRAQKRNRDPSVNFRRMDAAKLEYPDNSFDGVFDFGIIHHVPNWRDCISELRRVCKHGAYLLLEELAIESFSGFPGILWRKILTHPYADMFTFEDFETILQANGFRILNKKYSKPLGLIKLVSLVATLDKR